MLSRSRLVTLAAALFAVALTTAAPRALQAASPAPGVVKVGVGGVGFETLAPELRAKLERAIAAGLSAAGAEVQTEKTRSDAAYWVRGSCQIDGSTYRLHLELVEGRTGKVAVARDDACEICTEAEAAEMANVAASALKAALGPAGARPAAGATPTGPAAAMPTATATPGVTEASGASAGRGTSPQPDATDAGIGWRRLVPWAGVAVGAAALGVGAYYWSLDGKVTCSAPAAASCADVYDTKLQGGIWMGVGAALAVTGAVLLIIPDRSPDRAPDRAARRAPGAAAPIGVAISPTGLAVAGRF